MPGPLKLPRWEAFAQAMAKGMSRGDAYAAAGFKPNTKNASRLYGRPEVQARLAELQERAADKAVVTVADIARQLDDDRNFARKLESPSAAVSATMGKAKVLGLIVDRQQHNFDLSGLSDDDLDALERIRERLTKP